MLIYAFKRTTKERGEPWRFAVRSGSRLPFGPQRREATDAGDVKPGRKVDHFRRLKSVPPQIG